MAKVVTTITITLENVPDEFVTEENIVRYKENVLNHIKSESDVGVIITIDTVVSDPSQRAIEPPTRDWFDINDF